MNNKDYRAKLSCVVRTSFGGPLGMDTTEMTTEYMVYDIAVTCPEESKSTETIACPRCNENMTVKVYSSRIAARKRFLSALIGLLIIGLDAAFVWGGALLIDMIPDGNDLGIWLAAGMILIGFGFAVLGLGFILLVTCGRSYWGLPHQYVGGEKHIFEARRIG